MKVKDSLVVRCGGKRAILKKTNDENDDENYDDENLIFKALANRFQLMA